MKKIFIFTLISLSIFLSFCNFTIVNFIKTPDSIITNNDSINYYETINTISNNVSNDTLNYSFNRENIEKDIYKFKTFLIEEINSLLLNGNNILAKNLLEKYLFLYEKDEQLLTLKEHINSLVNQTNLVEYSGEIEALSFSPLISYPELIFNKLNPNLNKLDEKHITTSEFQKILFSLYEKNYVLISPKDIKVESNKITTHIPKNKKPLIIFLDDVEYCTNKIGSVDKLILNDDNNIITYTPKRSIHDRIGHNNDFITILEQFIAEHPSFSHNNSKATIVVDGSNGIFGYNTQKTNATSKFQIKKATQIINHLKSIGYTFASEGYKHNASNNYLEFASGLNNWNNHIKNIVGEDTNIFHLNTTLNNFDNDTEKINLLKTYGFSVVVGFENSSKIARFEDFLYIPAKHIGGSSLRYLKGSFEHLFDSEFVYDHINRTIPYFK